jgi:5-methylcytosine-specific restriction endonuclease McrA
MPRARGWTDEQLTEAVAVSRTLSEVCKRLGIRPGKYDVLRRHIARLGLDASHILWSGEDARKHRRSWDVEDLAAAVAASDSVSEVSRRLGYTPNGGVHRMILGYIRNSGFDTSHFTGMRWARGRRLPKIPLDEILVENSTYRANSRLRMRLIAAGLLKPECAVCGLTTWRGQRLPLHLDHINGDHTDNRLENLRILCPNCHSLTDTWCGRDRGRRIPTGRETALRTPTVRVRIPPPAPARPPRRVAAPSSGGTWKDDSDGRALRQLWYGLAPFLEKDKMASRRLTHQVLDLGAGVGRRHDARHVREYAEYPDSSSPSITSAYPVIADPSADRRASG